VRAGVARVLRDGLLEEARGPLERVPRALVPQVAALEIQAVCLEVCGRARDERPGFLAAELEFECTHDRSCDLVLHGEDVSELALVGLAPELVAVGGVDELRPHLEAVPGHADAPLEHRADAQRVGDRANAQVLAFERERRGPCRNAESFDLCERVDQLLRHPVGEVLVLSVRAEVREWEDRDRPDHSPARIRRRAVRLAGDDCVDGECEERDRRTAVRRETANLARTLPGAAHLTG
jgi:hypothetical protein